MYYAPVLLFAKICLLFVNTSQLFVNYWAIVFLGFCELLLDVYKNQAIAFKQLHLGYTVTLDSIE